jgi:hypothetical protein
MDCEFWTMVEMRCSFGRRGIGELLASERFVRAQGRHHLLAKPADRSREIALGQIGEIELAHKGIEQTRFRGDVNLFATILGEPMDTASRGNPDRTGSP